ncbi:hypothetical protein TCAL_15428 [Tigriopus californicus]|uniref:CUB domain-containing protein n=1 Tax=Tigriopus californicus TaxID=6832 RepID=A0A553PSQ4_TIGCA|nr:hypothetical protein TCAL_15428 [Tigriopus californicus]
MTDIVQSYNFAGGHHLANQNHLFCVRREANKCRICWTTTAEGDFELTGAMTGANARQTPFQARFLSDGGEIVADVTNPPNGVRLAYILTDC